jgi:N-acyl homoserine lactone hydrolase
MAYTIRPLCSGHIPTRPLEYWYHFSCKKYVEAQGITNDLGQLPDFTYLIEGGEQLILVDTGMSWTERADKYHHGPSLQRQGIDDIESRLKQVGYKPEDVDIVIFTHLHWDHVFYIEKFKNARFICSKAEWEYAHNPIPLHFKSYERPIIAKDGDVIVAPFDQPGISERFEFVEGETEIVPGITQFPVPGHCPGHIAVQVETEDGPYFCVGDAVFVMGNIDVPEEMAAELHYDITPPGRYVDIVAAWNSIRELIRRNKEAGVDPHKHLLLAHDHILDAAVDQYMEEHNNKIPVIGKNNTDFVFEKYKNAEAERKELTRK